MERRAGLRNRWPGKSLLLAPLVGMTGAMAAEAWGQCESAILVDELGAAGDRFGSSVGVSADGQTVVVGAESDDDLGDRSGSAFVFRLDPASGEWIEEAHFTNPNSIRFGFSVAVSADGNTAVVTALVDDAPGSAPGSGTVYVRKGSTWTEQAILTAGEPGCCDSFGLSVTLSADGNRAIFGARGDGDDGAAFVFVRDGSTWTQQARLTRSVPTPCTRFGSAVAISGDGQTAVIGARDRVCAAPGDAYVFFRTGSVWTEQARLDPSNSHLRDQFGGSVAVSGDGSTTLVAAFLDNEGGAVYVFVRNGSTWTQQARIRGIDTKFARRLGLSCALSGDGGMAVVGAMGDDHVVHALAAGSAFVFVREESTWTQRTRLSASSLAPLDLFGWSVAVSDDASTLVVGANEQYSNGNGSAYVFSLLSDDGDGDGVFPCDNCPADPNSEQADCNRDGVGDVCAIAGGISEDCNENGIPDDCEFAYSLDDASADDSLGAINPADTIWLNQFVVTPGNETITAIGIGWAPPPEGGPTTLLVYDDPDNDGDPTDAVLLRTAVIEDVSSLPRWFFVMPIEPTFVGNPGDSFFIGASLTQEPGQFPMAIDFSSPYQAASWIALAAPGTADLEDLTNNPLVLIGDACCEGNWPLRAFSSQGAQLAADINGDGGVDELDLISLLSAWGGLCPEPPAACPADVNDDGVVNVLDLIVMLLDFGATCP